MLVIMKGAGVVPHSRADGLVLRSHSKYAANAS